MAALEKAKEILDTMLGHLGFVVRIEAVEDEQGLSMQVLTEETAALTGPDGERLDDFQYLLNLLVRSFSGSEVRVRVDVEHFRQMREDVLVEEARRLARTVLESGQPLKMRPLNSYYRRVVHNAFVSDPEIMTWSPRDQARLKRITLMRRARSRG